MRNKALFAAVLAAVLSASPLAAQAQTNDGASQGATNVYLQLQEMRYEMRELRGMVEELNHEVQRLRQRQIDDYQDLDSRMSGVPATATVPAPASGAAPLPPAATMELDPLMGAASGGNDGEPAPARPQESAAGEGTELDSYSAAYDLLKERRIDDSTAAFLAHLQRYPRGQYAANAHYWLGEIHLLQNDLGAAETSFATVVNEFADDRKVPDALFKLGRVYHLQGQSDKAREALTRVAATNTSAAALARAYLQDHF